MIIRLPIVVLCLVLLVADSSLSAQSIFRPFSGERGIEMVRDIEEQDLISKMGEPCGEYFLYEEVGDQKILTFKVAVTKKEKRLATTSLVRIVTRLIDIDLDDKRMAPTAEFISPGIESGERWRVKIRISSRDFEAADCIPGSGK